GANHCPRAAPAVLRSAQSIRAAHRRPGADQHFIQHVRPTHRMHASGRAGVLRSLAAGRVDHGIVVAREAPSLTPRISVVVPSYRRIALLDRCLSALVAQDLPGSQFEIIVVHDGPSEACRRLAQQWRRRIGPQKGPGFAFHEQSHRGPAAARNVGWRAACAEIVAFTDDDTEPDSRWLSSALEGFAADADAA